MGQKVNPIGNRLGINKTWDSKWFSRKNSPRFIVEDVKIREFIEKKLFGSGIGKVIIERAGKSVRVNIYSARPGIIIGRKGADIEVLKNELETITDANVNLNIIPIKKPELNAQIVAHDIAQQLLKKGSYKRAIKKAIARAITGGAQGIKVKVGGRLGGAEIARSEWLREGRIPLQTLKADIDYGFSESLTKYGKIGVKVWIFIDEAAQGRVVDLAPEYKADKAAEETEKAEKTEVKTEVKTGVVVPAPEESAAEPVEPVEKKEDSEDDDEDSFDLPEEEKEEENKVE